MSAQLAPSSTAWSRTEVCILLACLGVAAISARPFAGGWNDGSRLAAVESIVDRHTLAN